LIDSTIFLNVFIHMFSMRWKRALTNPSDACPPHSMGVQQTMTTEFDRPVLLF
jgi:hypothetical protein